ncbi:MAG TPA: ATP-binding protein [Bryobacteraceae bacterium]|nr:ATP-binding protein [Bryobacteraceae bacterium]
MPLIAIVSASLLTFAMLRTIGPNAAIGYSFLFAIMAAAWWGGYGPGLLACALSFFVVPYGLVPKFNPAKTDLNRLALTALVSLLISRVAATRRRAEETLRAANAELEGRVRERTLELERANTALAEKAAQLERSNASLEQYAYAASHDLQEPLRMVNVYAQLLARRYEGHLDAAGHEYINFITTGSRRMQNLVADLLSYSRVVADSEQFSTEVASHEIVADAVSNCRAGLEGTGATVTYGSLPRVCGNREQILEVFQNMISNALKYGKPGEPVRIQVEAAESGSFWEFSVRDNGIGIDMQYADYIFRLFKRLHGGELPGTGIGLALCKRVVEQHGGRIWVESSPGQGSTFKFTLPISGSKDFKAARHGAGLL